MTSLSPVPVAPRRPFPGPADARPAPPRRHVLVSGVSSDAHTWNLVFLHLLLEEMGYRVTNLGSCVPDDLLIDACRRLRPDALVLSSVNGHGALDGGRVIARLRRDPELLRLFAVIGGKLGVDGASGAHGPRLLEAGFDAVFEDGVPTGDFCRSLGRAVPVLAGAHESAHDRPGHRPAHPIANPAARPTAYETAYEPVHDSGPLRGCAASEGSP
ncbi:cobalamin B12-binding domain-containing protein [Streptomyces sp. NPDC014894]|uniref:cobalamin B12-binding domain-containing protein n=1 Tax=unclassified Streptomyces TaxID=2593676 RepID=UPI0036F80641